MAIRMLIVGAIVLSSVAGCAGREVHRPQNELNVAAQAIESARLSNAHQFASFEIATADRKFAQAQSLANSDKDDDRIKARRLAEETAADARLAEARANLARAQVAKRQMSQTVETLRRESAPTEGETP